MFCKKVIQINITCGIYRMQYKEWEITVICEKFCRRVAKYLVKKFNFKFVFNVRKTENIEKNAT